MLEALLLAAVVVGLLSCPLMMSLGRRGVGPGCATPGCADSREGTLADLRCRERELGEEIVRLEAGDERAPVRQD